MRLFDWLLAAAVLSLASCVSSERMTRLSPLGQNAAEMSESRVNLWPCYYADRGFQSALWPCFDLDSHGMAVRPFYNQEGKEYSILFPLTAWNPEKGDGWCLSGYWNDKNCGAFPLFHAANDIHYVGPVWWTNKYYGLFPALCFSRGFNYFGPFYANFEKDYGGMAPLVHVGRDDNWFVPLYCWSGGQDRFAWALCGLAGHSPSTRWALPLYLSRRWEEQGELDLFFPAYLRYAEGSDRLYATLLFSYGWNQDTGENNFLQALGPLFARGTGKDDARWTLAAWPLWFSYADKTRQTWRSCLLFMLRSNAAPAKDKTELVFFPLLSVHNESPALVNVNHDGFNALGWLLFSHLRQDNSEWCKFPSSDWIAAAGNLSLKLRGSTLNSSQYNSLFYNQWDETWKVWDTAKVKLDAVKAIRPRRHTGVYDREWLRSDYAASPTAKPDSARQERVELLTKEGFKPESDRDKDIDKATWDFAAENTRLVDYNTTLVPFLYRGYACEGHAKRWWFFKFVQAESSPEHDRLAVLWRAYRSQRDGQTQRTDMFPFVSWSSSPETQGFSFCWRLWSRQTKPDGASGHIFFIPW